RLDTASLLSEQRATLGGCASRPLIVRLQRGGQRRLGSFRSVRSGTADPGERGTRPYTGTVLDPAPNERPKRLMLLDGNGLIYRGYFALPPLTTSKGELVNAVFGFASIVLRGFQDIGPDYVALAFDLPEPTFRHQASAAYNPTR